MQRTYSHFQGFKTDRLLVEDWLPFLNDPAKRKRLEHELKDLLTPKITQFLPLSMQFPADNGSIAKWVSDRAGEAQILCVHGRDAATLVGLIILADDPEPAAIPTFHLGYFLGEKYWRKGYATELVMALVAGFEIGPQIRFVAVVDRSNAASARVLKKSGFKRLPEQSTADRDIFGIVVPSIDLAQVRT